MHGERASRNANRTKDWNGRRPNSPFPVSVRSGTNKFFMRIVHKIERRMGKQRIDDDQSTY